MIQNKVFLDTLILLARFLFMAVVYCWTIGTLCLSAEDMAKFVENYPEYKKMHGNVSKHVTLVTEMSKMVEERKLMLVSETEQELACNGGQGAAFEVVYEYGQFCSFRLDL